MYRRTQNTKQPATFRANTHIIRMEAELSTRAIFTQVQKIYRLMMKVLGKLAPIVTFTTFGANKEIKHTVAPAKTEST